MIDMEAKAYEENKRIEAFLEKLGKCMGTDTVFTKRLVTEFVVLVVAADMKGIVYNKMKPMSLKPGNLFVDMKGALKAAAEIFAGYQKPDSWLSGVQLLLLLILSLKGIVNVNLPENSAEIIIQLNRMGAYDSPVEETVLRQKVWDLEKERGLELVEHRSFMETMEFLDRYKIVELRDGKVRLAEKVFGKDFA